MEGQQDAAPASSEDPAISGFTVEGETRTCAATFIDCEVVSHPLTGV
jgi:hypothetical protein